MTEKNMTMKGDKNQCRLRLEMNMAMKGETKIGLG